MKDVTIDYILRATWQAVARMYNEEAKEFDQGEFGTRQEKYIGYGTQLTDYISFEMPKKDKIMLRKKYANNQLFLRVGISDTGDCNILNLYLGFKNIYEPVFAEIIDGKVLFEPRLIDGKGVKTWRGYNINIDEL